jgi:hypothetical protein
MITKGLGNAYLGQIEARSYINEADTGTMLHTNAGWWGMMNTKPFEARLQGLSRADMLPVLR